MTLATAALPEPGGFWQSQRRLVRRRVNAV